jgi:hypothetical protein
MLSVNVAAYSIILAIILIILNCATAMLYTKYCVPNNLWTIIFVAGSPVCHTITMIQSKSLDLYITIWYSFAVALVSSVYSFLNWCVPKGTSSKWIKSA